MNVERKKKGNELEREIRAGGGNESESHTDRRTARHRHRGKGGLRNGGPGGPHGPTRCGPGTCPADRWSHTVSLTALPGAVTTAHLLHPERSLTARPGAKRTPGRAGVEAGPPSFPPREAQSGTQAPRGPSALCFHFSRHLPGATHFLHRGCGLGGGDETVGRAVTL